MTPSEATSLHHTPLLVCPYCGNQEPLPADAAERHRHLPLRLIQLQRAREAIEAPVQSYQQIRQVWAFGLAVAVAIGAWQLWTALTIARADAAVDIGSLIVPLLSAAPMVGLITGWLAMQRAFVRQLRPLLRARPPRSPELAARCRVCGGDLAGRGPEITCTFCGAPNLLGPELTSDAAALLAAETEEYHRRAQGWRIDPGAYAAPSRMFMRWGAIGAGCAVAVGITAALVLS